MLTIWGVPLLSQCAATFDTFGKCNAADTRTVSTNTIAHSLFPLNLWPNNFVCYRRCWCGWPRWWKIWEESGQSSRSRNSCGTHSSLVWWCLAMAMLYWGRLVRERFCTLGNNLKTIFSITRSSLSEIFGILYIPCSELCWPYSLFSYLLCPKAMRSSSSHVV